MIVRDGRRVERNLGPRRIHGSEVAWNMRAHGQVGRDGNSHSNGAHFTGNFNYSPRHPDREMSVLTEVVEL